MERVSNTPTGDSGNDASLVVDISADGNYVVFESLATDLVTNQDDNGTFDIYLRDLLAGTTEMVSVSQSGAAGNAESRHPVISNSGDYVVFHSKASDISATPVSGAYANVMIWERSTGSIDVVSLDCSGQLVAGDSFVASVSFDGSYVAFESRAILVPGFSGGVVRTYLRDMTQPGTCTIVSTNRSLTDPNGSSGNPIVSSAGRYVTFWSSATNLHPGATNGGRQMFVKDTWPGGQLELISVDPAGVQGNASSSSRGAISASGRFVAFMSEADNLLGNGVDLNGERDVFLRDRLLNQTRLISARPDWVPGNPSAQANDLCEAHVDLSDDGRYVVFASHATNLVLPPPPDTTGMPQVYVHDRDPDEDGVFDEVGYTISMASMAADGAAGNGPSISPAIESSGARIAYHSGATNLVPAPDPNGNLYDVFVHHSYSRLVPFCFGDRQTPACPCLNAGNPGHGCENSSITGGGRLDGTGLPCVGQDSLRLSASALSPNKPALFFQGQGVVANQFIPFGDGLRCVAGPIRRLGIRTADASGNVSFGFGNPGDPSIGSVGMLPPGGGTRFYQVWYRDPASFCTPDTFQFSSGIIARWVP